MPVKVRCSACSTVLNVPDKAAGKTIACPKCKEKIKVPAAGPASRGPSKSQSSKPKPKPKSPSVESGDLFGGMAIDDYSMDHDEEQICPYCAADMEYDDDDELIPVCANCGMNIETGEMDAREKKKRNRRGPNTELYWRGVWADSWAFCKEFSSLGIRTGVYIGLFLVLANLSAYMIAFCKGAPTKTFWGVLAVISSLGIPGWYWMLSKKIVFASIVKETIQPERIFFDLFEAMSVGLRATFWPVIVFLPVLIPIVAPVLALSLFTPTMVGIVAAAILCIPSLILFPIAMCHFTSRYTYKGWILWELLKLLPKNFAGAAYWAIVAFAVTLPVALVAGPTFYFLGSPNIFFAPNIAGIQEFPNYIKDAETGKLVPEEVLPEIAADAPFNQLGVSGKATLWLMKMADLGESPSSAYYYMLKGPMNITFAFLIYLPLGLMLGFPLVFAMKANGVFGHYFTNSLGLVQRVTPNTPATFWVRCLSSFVDILFFPLVPFVVTANAKALSALWGLIGVLGVVWLFNRQFLLIAGVLVGLYAWWMYWVISESSPMRASMGKEGFGLVVLPEKGEQPISIQQANIRWLMRCVTLILLGVPDLLILFDPNKQALHDKASKTRVVWKGDK
ncbi:MAG: RDD family protein [Planctomycetaceae bacterium]|nr:RDD family protein [Planctomycetaceae bacterium]